MDIGALSVSMSQTSLSQAVAVRVMAIAQDQVEQQGQNLMKLMESVPHPNLGHNLDIKA